MYGSGYVWIVIGPSMIFGHLIFDAPNNMSCSLAELEEASKGYFVLSYYVVSKEETVTISGQVSIFIDIIYVIDSI